MERAHPLCVGGLDPAGCGVLWCWLEIMGFVFFLSGLPWGPPGIFGDESEADKKQDSTHFWHQTPEQAGAVGFSSPLWSD